jgi:serine/threonine protein kinase
MSRSTVSNILASRPFGSDESSSRTLASETGKRPGRFLPPSELDLGDFELKFLRVVGRYKVPIAAHDDIQLDCLDRESDTSARHGATMVVHKGSWKGQRVAVKYVRRSHIGEAYRRAMVDLNHELALMTKPSLRGHRNITKLLAVCFDKASEDTDGSPDPIVHPGVIVELAHEQYPDLAQFFDISCYPDRTKRLPFQTGANFVADIADGITALHDHDIVHADLKPSNILLFPDINSPSKLTAKISDFGFVGIIISTPYGRQKGLAGDRPRGGTAEWSAPECLENPDTWFSNGSLEHPQYKACIDIYSFGLLSSYIALDGQTPLEYVPNLSNAKLSDTMRDKVVTRLEEHYCQDSLDGEKSFKESAMYIAKQTLNLDWKDRIDSLRSIRAKVFGT